MPNPIESGTNINFNQDERFGGGGGEAKKSPEEIEAGKQAMDKLITPLDYYYLVHGTTLKRLPSIFKFGLVPNNPRKFEEAKKIGAEIPEIDSESGYATGSNHFWDPWGRKRPHPEDIENGQPKYNARRIRVTPNEFPIHEGNEHNDQHDAYITLLIDLQGITDFWKTESTGEVWANNIVDPENIIGIVTTRQGLDESLSAAITDQSIKHKIPLYNIHGDLLWPQRMTRDEIDQLIAKREREQGKTKPRIPEDFEKIAEHFFSERDYKGL